LTWALIAHLKAPRHYEACKGLGTLHYYQIPVNQGFVHRLNIKTLTQALLIAIHPYSFPIHVITLTRLAYLPNLYQTWVYNNVKESDCNVPSDSMRKAIFDWLFPSYCVQCQSPIDASLGLCKYCLDDLPLFDLTKNTNLLHRPDIIEMFPNCEFDKLFACAFYQSPFELWLKQLKFNNQIYYKKALQQVIKKQLTQIFLDNASLPDTFVILPLHKSRFLNRGFNQVTQVWQPCLAEFASLSNALVRNKKTQAQSELSKAKRVKNLKNAFLCTEDMRGKTVAIIDDIMTTGATLNAATDALKQAGAKQVWAFTTCLTPI
jgi:ComF family protein